MDNLLAFASEESPYGPLVESAILHYQFETIHPFEDGNGRIGRLLIPLHLQRRGALDRPVLYVSGYLDAHRDAYIEQLYNVSARGTWVDWILFFLTALAEQSRDTASKAKSFTDLHRVYAERARHLSSKAAFRAIDLITEQLVVSVSYESRQVCSSGGPRCSR